MKLLRTAALIVAGAVAGGVWLAAPAQADFHDTKIVSTTINNGKPLVFGTNGNASLSVPVTMVISDDSGGLATVDARLLAPDINLLNFLEGEPDHNMTCVSRTSTTATCTGIAVVGQTDLDDKMAGPGVRVQINGYALDSGDYHLWSSVADSVPLLQQSLLTTANATPEPARRASTLTVTGKLTRPDWSYTLADGDKRSIGYAGQKVRLQFKKNGTTAYRTVKTVTSSSTGGLRTTTPAVLPASGAGRTPAAAGPSTPCRRAMR